MTQRFKRVGKRVQRQTTRVDWSRYAHLLGKYPDTELAQRIGCNQTTVWNERQKRGIEAYHPPRLGLRIEVAQMVLDGDLDGRLDEIARMSREEEKRT